ncbi:ABC transporter substrate-binding protein [Wielerella bovis]|uniref:ABC transporter substrate-binding protein n=1 Tax=Wielerella bovis TaxID=2917790 RepID=UPI0020192EEB|nr:ABC transporter substrate-binding protein [Wielerella bovis]ULJ60126.1 ABC transporter substrate-binding protein [Wielerella bovis]
MKKLFFILLILPTFTLAAPRIATSDWTVAETLTALGRPPIMVGDKTAYRTWVAYPALPPSTADMGLRMQPNREYLHRMQPDFFIQTPFYAGIENQLAQIAPVKKIATATEQGTTWAQTLIATRQIAIWADAKPQAEKIIADAEKHFAIQKQQLVSFNKRPIAVIQFADARHVRVYGNTSLFHVVLGKLGLQNAWTGESNAWGFANVALSDLARLPENTLVLIVKPNPLGLEQSLQNSVLWKRLPMSRRENHRFVDTTWAYGGIPSMVRFSDLLVAALRQK